MVTEIQERSARLVDEILQSNYYVSLFSTTLKDNGMVAEGVKGYQYSGTQLTSMWNDFWFALPDAHAIRHGPFFELCNLCEMMGDE